MSRNTAIKKQVIQLTGKQIEALYYEWKKGTALTLVRTEGQYTHLYVASKNEEKDGRCTHVSKAGKAVSCEGMFP